MNLREQFKKETGKDHGITVRALAHAVTVCNPEYVRWLEDQMNTNDDIKEDDINYVTITGVEGASGFNEKVKLSDLEARALEIYKAHPDAEGYFKFTKYLWVKYPNGKEQRLDSIIPYK